MQLGQGAGSRRRRSPILLALRAGIAIGVLLFLVAQPTDASPRLTTFAPPEPVTTTTLRPATVALAAVVPTLAPAPTTLPAPKPTAPPTTRPQPRPTIPQYSADAAPVALTFDDGPNDTFTPQVLDILDRYRVRATFFVVGSEVDRLPDLTRRLVNDGHVLGNHTWDHVDLTTLDEDGFRAQIDRTEDLLATFTGHRASCARPPYGRINQYARDQLHARGLTPTRWSADTADWKRPGVDEIVRRALEGARPGAVILMHDSGPDMSQTIEALPRIIEGMRSRGLRVAPICN